MTKEQKEKYFNKILEDYYVYRERCLSKSQEPDSLVTYACLSSDVGEDDTLFNDFYEWSRQY